jgi:hypothetical protein
MVIANVDAITGSVNGKEWLVVESGAGYDHDYSNRGVSLSLRLEGSKLKAIFLLISSARSSRKCWQNLLAPHSCEAWNSWNPWGTFPRAKTRPNLLVYTKFKRNKLVAVLNREVLERTLM